MKRLLVLFTCAALLAALALPSVVLAGNGNGKAVGKSSAPGQMKKATSQAPVEQPAPPRKEKEKEKGGEKAPTAKKGTTEPDAHASHDASETPVRTREQEESEQTSGTVAPKRTGVANAFDRISANLARAEARMAEGTRKTLPPGLVRVLEKFMLWLGISPDTAADITPDDAADEPSLPSNEDTVTPSPDHVDSPDGSSSDEPSDTPAPGDPAS